MSSINVILKTISPLHVAFPEGKNETTKLKVVVNGDAKNESIRYDDIPIYPANGFRGGLRRAAANRIVKHLNEHIGPVRIPVYLGMRCGASSGQPKSYDKAVEPGLKMKMTQLARNHVYMGLFGGGDGLHRSAYSVSDMVPILQSTVNLNMVPNLYPATQGNGRDLLTHRTSIRVDDINMDRKPIDELINVIEGGQSAIIAHQLDVSGNATDRRDAGDADVKKTDVQNMMGIEAIAPGTPMHFSINIAPSATDAQIGLLLISLADLFNQNQFGGWIRCGFGKVRVEKIQFISSEGDEMTWESHELLDNESRFAWPSDVDNFIETANEEIYAINMDDLINFFDAKQKEKPAKKAKAGKATDGA